MRQMGGQSWGVECDIPSVHTAWYEESTYWTAENACITIGAELLVTIERHIDGSSGKLMHETLKWSSR